MTMPERQSAGEDGRTRVETYWLGSVPYREAWDLQQRLVDAVRRQDRPDSLLLVEHPHVFTMGRRATSEHLLWDEAERARRGVEVVWVDRGGDVTYHGPGQLVGYPILDLRRHGADVLLHLRKLEDSLIRYLGAGGIAAERVPDYTGVWSGGAKVAAIGVKLDGSVTSHGFALNLTADLDYFRGIVPCGIEDKPVTTVERLGGGAVAVADAARAFTPHFAEVFGTRVEWPEAARLEGLPEPARRPLTLPVAAG
jgi:lipoate-protein ligase B